MQQLNKNSVGLSGIEANLLPLQKSPFLPESWERDKLVNFCKLGEENINFSSKARDSLLLPQGDPNFIQFLKPSQMSAPESCTERKESPIKIKYHHAGRSSPDEPRFDLGS